jgi:hypothetical protein
MPERRPGKIEYGGEHTRRVEWELQPQQRGGRHDQQRRRDRRNLPNSPSALPTSAMLAFKHRRFPLPLPQDRPPPVDAR